MSTHKLCQTWEITGWETRWKTEDGAFAIGTATCAVKEEEKEWAWRLVFLCRTHIDWNISSLNYRGRSQRTCSVTWVSKLMFWGHEIVRWGCSHTFKLIAQPTFSKRILYAVVVIAQYNFFKISRLKVLKQPTKNRSSEHICCVSQATMWADLKRAHSRLAYFGAHSAVKASYLDEFRIPRFNKSSWIGVHTKHTQSENAYPRRRKYSHHVL